MKKIKAGIFGLEGTTLTKEEKHFFVKHNPLGFILFTRNCETQQQVKSLTNSLRELLSREDVFILIDQEGGRVARLKPPHWHPRPPASLFAECASHSIAEGRKATYTNARLIAHDLQTIGINVNCAPLADLPVAGSHEIIGDRAYGDDPHQVSLLAEAMARGLLEGGVLPVLKHIPGHGRATADSHLELPVVETTLADLRKSDFIPFCALNKLPLGMTAHIIYSALDSQYPATLSRNIIKLIRNEIKFDGLLMTDDLSMKALKGNLDELTHASLAAGCDVVLHCNGKMDEMSVIAKSLPVLTDIAILRFERALAQLIIPKPYEYGQAERYIATIQEHYSSS